MKTIKKIVAHRATWLKEFGLRVIAQEWDDSEVVEMKLMKGDGRDASCQVFSHWTEDASHLALKVESFARGLPSIDTPMAAQSRLEGRRVRSAPDSR